MLKTKKWKFYKIKFDKWKESSLRVTLTQREQMTKKLCIDTENKLNNYYEMTNSVKNNDWRVKKFKFIIIIFDHERIKADKRSHEYLKVFIGRLNWVINEKLNNIYNIVEARVSSKNKSKKFKKLNHCRFYDLCNII